MLESQSCKLWVVFFTNCGDRPQSGELGDQSFDPIKFKLCKVVANMDIIIHYICLFLLLCVLKMGDMWHMFRVLYK